MKQSKKDIVDEVEFSYLLLSLFFFDMFYTENFQKKKRQCIMLGVNEKRQLFEYLVSTSHLIILQWGCKSKKFKNNKI